MFDVTQVVQIQNRYLPVNSFAVFFFIHSSVQLVHPALKNSQRKELFRHFQEPLEIETKAIKVFLWTRAKQFMGMIMLTISPSGIIIIATHHHHHRPPNMAL